MVRHRGQDGSVGVDGQRRDPAGVREQLHTGRPEDELQPSQAGNDSRSMSVSQSNDATYLPTSAKVSSRMVDRLAGTAEYSSALDGPSRNRNSCGRPGMLLILSQWNGRVRSTPPPPSSSITAAAAAATRGILILTSTSTSLRSECLTVRCDVAAHVLILHHEGFDRDSSIGVMDAIQINSDRLRASSFA